MDLTTYGQVVAAFGKLNLKAEDEVTFQQCSSETWEIFQRSAIELDKAEWADALGKIEALPRARFFTPGEAGPKLKDVLQWLLSPAEESPQSPVKSAEDSPQSPELKRSASWPKDVQSRRLRPGLMRMSPLGS
eukprot:Skav216990  [mRNA]  locus=scaffold594:261897:264904:- [translate_table: standard]